MTPLAHTLFKVYIIPDIGDYAYKGHILIIDKDIPIFFTQLLTSLEDMPHCIVRKTDGLNTNNQYHWDFKVSIIKIWRL